MPFHLIDPPGPFASLDKWESFLQHLKTLPKGNFEVRTEIAYARKWIARLKAESTKQPKAPARNSSG
jgi:hypothetical protein